MELAEVRVIGKGGGAEATWEIEVSAGAMPPVSFWTPWSGEAVSTQSQFGENITATVQASAGQRK